MRSHPAVSCHGDMQGVVISPELLSCLPDRLHPVSLLFLQQWLDGSLPTNEFLRWFHMPNSDYIPVAQCLLATVAGS